MFADKESFKAEYLEEIISHYGKSIEDCGKQETYEALVRLIYDRAATLRADTHKRYLNGQKKEVYYFSMEFLIGKLLHNYLINFGVEDAVREGYTACSRCNPPLPNFSLSSASAASSSAYSKSADSGHSTGTLVAASAGSATVAYFVAARKKR